MSFFFKLIANIFIRTLKQKKKQGKKCFFFQIAAILFSGRFLKIGKR